MKKTWTAILLFQIVIVMYGLLAQMIPFFLVDKTSLDLNVPGLILLDILFIFLLFWIVLKPKLLPYEFGTVVCVILLLINLVQLGPFYLSIPRYYLPYRIAIMQLAHIIYIQWSIPLPKGIHSFIFICGSLLPYVFFILNIYVYIRLTINAKSIFKKA